MPSCRSPPPYSRPLTPLGALLVAKMPISRVPMMPPTRCTPTTSSESSKPRRNFHSMASEQTAPAMAPMATAPSGLTAPQAGVMATRAETSPEAAPMLVVAPCLIRSTMAQASRPADAATAVLRNTTDAEWPAVSADPALNPNQPTQSRPAPTSTRGRLCGLECSIFGQPELRPRTSARARAAAPAFMCTAVPPAKSMALMPLAIQPPTVLPSAESNANTQCAIGKYTTVAQMPAKTIQAPNFMRPAAAPATSAVVTQAKNSWNAANRMTGMDAESSLASSCPMPGNSVTSPIRPRPPTELPKAIE